MKKPRDERWETLKRRVQLLARLEGRTVTLDTGLHVVVAPRVREVEPLVARLRAFGALDRGTFERCVELERPALAITTTLLATAQRDLRALSIAPARALAREHKKALARTGEIDDAWLAAKRARVDALSVELAREASARRAPAAWFAGVLELARALHGDASARRLDDARARLLAVGAERRRQAAARVEALARALAPRPSAPAAPEELAPLVARLERARELPGRARRARVLEVLRAAVGWPDAPPDAVRALGEPGARADFAAHVRRAGDAIVRALPAGREPRAADEALSLLATAGLRFRVGEEGVPLLSHEDVRRARAREAALVDLVGADLTLAQALRVAELDVPSRHERRRVAKWVAEGLDLELVASAFAAGRGATLLQAQSARAARAYATWALRLLPQYEAAGIELALSPELFSNLPRNEDLGVLAVCLMETERRPGGDPIAVLDATLGLFQRLPAKASGILGRLRGTTPGAGEAAFPELAAWLDDDALLDRYVHLARLSGRPVALSKTLREDFDHAEKAARERAHLEGLAARSSRQEARLAALASRDRTLEGAPRGRTRRRLAEAIDALLPIAYRHELDATFREILRTAWGITAPGALTPAWRDAVRFWLVVDDNRELLGQLLRLAAASPGRDVKLAFAKNRAWLDRARFDRAAWLAPRREALPGGWVVELEEDPLEVLRMGIPFGTCLALETGFNAASTVVNAVDANKRVLYVRGRGGQVVARKLLAVTEDGALVGYNLYVATSGPEARAIRDAVHRMCAAIAREAGLRLAAEGEPRRLHGTFWYDDGTVPFEEEDADAAAYCRALGLAPPRKVHDELASEAKGQAAIGAGDVDAALEALDRWGSGPANRRLGRWVVSRLGRREAARRAEARYALLPTLLEADDEDALLGAIALAAKEAHRGAVDLLEGVLARFPRSARVGRALARTCARGARSGSAAQEKLAHLTFTALALHVADVAGGLDRLDEIEPAWDAVASGSPSCASCVAGGRDAMLDAILDAFDAAPDHEAVTSCLSTRRRGDLAQRVALAIAARRRLDGGARAVQRALVLRPSLAALPEALAATLRQEELSAIDDAIARRLPAPSAAPFEALGELLFSCRGIARVLPSPAPRAALTWEPGPWELAFRRACPDPTLRRHLVEVARRAPLTASREMELLALLGDVEAFAEVPPPSARSRATRGRTAGAPPTMAKQMRARTECETVAASLRAQATAAAAGRVVALRGAKIVDRRLAEVAVARLRARRAPAEERAVSAEIVATAAHRVPWSSIAVDLAAHRDAASDDAARVLLGALPPGGRFTPVQLAEVWRREELREALASALAKTDTEDWAAVALASGAAGLTEAWALAKVERGHESASTTATSEQLWSVIRTVAERAPPDKALAFYQELPDALSAAFFLRSVRDLPRERGATLREVADALGWTGDQQAARRAWLDSTSLHKGRSSSIERG